MNNEPSAEAQELALLMDNTEWSYNDVQYCNGTAARHYVRGEWDLDKGVRLFRHPVDRMAKDQHAQHGGMFDRLADTFSVQDRNDAAEILALEFVALARNPEHWQDLGERAAGILTRAAAKASA